MKSVQSLNICKSFIKKIYDIAETHGGLIKIQLKENEGLFAARLPDGQEQVGTEFNIESPI